VLEGRSKNVLSTLDIKLSGIYPIEDTIVNNLNEIVASFVEFFDVYKNGIGKNFEADF